MPVSGEQPQEESRLGDYHLVALLAEGPRTRTYRAAQISIERAVVLERLNPGAEHEAEQFLADVRAKAAVDHPGIGSVFEAVDDGEAVYCTREFLPGRNFQELREAGATFLPSAIASFLRQVGAAME
jgi:serine/threonine protein kinase